MKSVCIFFAFFALLFYGCRKPARDIRMHGVIRDMNTGEPVPNATFNFWMEFGDRFSGSSMRRDGAAGTTNTNGEYEVIVRDADRNKEVGKTYIGDVHAYLMDDRFEFIPDFSERHEMHVDIPVEGRGKLYLVLTNTNPVNAQDQITNLYFSVPGDFPGGTSTYTGATVNDTVAGLGSVVSGQRILHSWVTKNSVTVTRTDTVYVHTATDTYYHLNY